MLRNYVLIVAGGVGNRMQSTIPKQYLLLHGKPVLMHTIARFMASGVDLEIIVVLHPDMEAHWQSLCQEHEFGVAHQVVYGGATRFDSVKNGLQHLENQGCNFRKSIIAVHDAARPLVAPQLIQEVFARATDSAASVLAVASTNSVRRGTAQESVSEDREKIWLVQTPQTFQGHILREAYQQQDQGFTDDASVVEKMGNAITLIPGDYRNIKITYPEDIAIAQIYMENLIT